MFLHGSYNCVYFVQLLQRTGEHNFCSESHPTTRREKDVFSPPRPRFRCPMAARSLSPELLLTSVLISPLKEVLRFTTSTEDVQITDQQRSGSSYLNLKLENARRELVYTENASYGSDVVYWQLPDRFLGRKISAYGGELRVKLRYEGNGVYRDSEPDVILLGMRLVLHHRFKDRLLGMFPQQLSVKIYETSFVKSDGYPASREDLMLVLANLQAVLVKATYVDDIELAA